MSPAPLAPREPAARGRRLLFLLAALAACAGLAAISDQLTAAWVSGRPVAVATPRAAVHRAERFLRRHAPAALAPLAAEVARAEREAAWASRLPWWQRDSDAAAAAWDRAVAAAWKAVREAELRGRSDRERWRVLEADAAAALARSRSEAETPGLGPEEARWVREAALQLDLARNFAAAGELARANRAAEEVVARAAAVRGRWEALLERYENPHSLARWRTWVDETVAESRRRGTNALVVDKLRRRLDVFSGGRRVDSFPVELSVQGLRRKLHAGDRATPEGRYRIVALKTGARTRYYKALLLDYPNREDLERFRQGQERGEVPDGADAGSLIEIHGGGGQGRDWTDGCIALTDSEMDRLFRWVRTGTPVTIVGTVADGGGGS